jgi:hypothetical protein
MFSKSANVGVLSKKIIEDAMISGFLQQKVAKLAKHLGQPYE